MKKQGWTVIHTQDHVPIDNFTYVSPEDEEEDMQPQRHDHMFNFQYVKSSKQITDKMTAKIATITKKIEERKGRIKDLRAEYKITDAVLIDLLEQAREAQRKNDNRMSYSLSNTPAKGGGGLTENTITIGAGVVNHLLTESDMVRSEEAEVTRLELVVRNLEDLENDQGKKVGHHLREEELKYLGF